MFYNLLRMAASLSLVALVGQGFALTARGGCEEPKTSTRFCVDTTVWNCVGAPQSKCSGEGMDRHQFPAGTTPSLFGITIEIQEECSQLCTCTWSIMKSRCIMINCQPWVPADMIVPANGPCYYSAIEKGLRGIAISLRDSTELMRAIM